ncbi:hypothetical protein Tco_0090482 [Tanacetum coccineum]
MTAEMMCGMDQLMERKEGGGMYLLWVPLIGDERTLMMDEAHASRLPRSSSGYDTNWIIVDRLTKVDKTLRFVEEPVGIIDREVKSLKRSRILIVKSIGTRSEVMRISYKLSIHICSLSKLSLEVLSKVGHIGLLAYFNAPLNVLMWFG